MPVTNGPIGAGVKHSAIAETVAAREALDRHRFTGDFFENHVLHRVDRGGVMGGAFEREPWAERRDRLFV